MNKLKILNIAMLAIMVVYGGTMYFIKLNNPDFDTTIYSLFIILPAFITVAINLVATHYQKKNNL